jgi:hypothetical protein
VNEIAKKLGVTRGAIIGKLDRLGFVRNIRKRKPRDVNAIPKKNRSSHNSLTEPWAEYSARKRREREALKAKGLFRIYQSAGRNPGK